MKTLLPVGLGMLFASLFAWALVPQTSVTEPAPDLEALIPSELGEWHQSDGDFLPMNLAPQREEDVPSLTEPYDQTVMRSYRNRHGEQVMLALAYGREQRQEVKIHRPELCYVSQGFRILSRQQIRLPYKESTIPSVRLVTTDGQRLEPVTYWIRLGSRFVTEPWELRMYLLTEGLLQRIPDGMLVRVSSAAPLAGADLEAEFDKQTRFLQDLLDAALPSAPAFFGQLEEAPPVPAAFPLK